MAFLPVPLLDVMTEFPPARVIGPSDSPETTPAVELPVMVKLPPLRFRPSIAAAESVADVHRRVVDLEGTGRIHVDRAGPFHAAQQLERQCGLRALDRTWVRCRHCCFAASTCPGRRSASPVKVLGAAERERPAAHLDKTGYSTDDAADEKSAGRGAASEGRALRRCRVQEDVTGPGVVDAGVIVQQRPGSSEIRGSRGVQAKPRAGQSQVLADIGRGRAGSQLERGTVHDGRSGGDQTQRRGIVRLEDPWPTVTGPV